MTLSEGGSQARAQTLALSDLRIVTNMSKGVHPMVTRTRPATFDDLASLEGAEEIKRCTTHESVLEEERCEWILLAEARFPRLAEFSATCHIVERVLLPPVKEEE